MGARSWTTRVRAYCALLVATILVSAAKAAEPTAELLVSSSGADNVSVINSATAAVTQVFKIGSGRRPSGAVAVSREGRLAFASGPKRLYVAEVPTATVQREIPLEFEPVFLAVPSTEHVLYAAGDRVDVLDYDSETTLATIPLNSTATDLAFNGDGSRVAVTGSGYVLMVDTETRNAVATIPVAGRATSATFASDGSRLYVGTTYCTAGRSTGSLSSLSGGNTPTPTPVVCRRAVDVFDTTTNAGVGSIPLRTDPSALAMSPDGAMLLAASSADNLVYVIDIERAEVQHVIYLAHPRQIAFAPDGARIYIVGDEISSIAADTFAVFETWPVRGGRIALTPDTAFAYVSGGAISVVDLESNTIVAEDVPNSPQAIALTPDGSAAYVAAKGILVLDPSTGAVRATIPLYATALGVTPDGAQLYATTLDGVVVVRTATNDMSAPLKPVYQGSIAFSPTSDVAYVTELFGDVGLLDTKLNRFFRSIRLFTAVDVAAAPGGGWAYVPAHLFGGILFLVSPAAARAFDAIELGSQTYPHHVAISSDGAWAYVAASDPNGVVLLVDLAAKTVADRIEFADQVGELAVDPTGAILFVSDLKTDAQAANGVSIIDLASTSVRAHVPIGPGALHLAIRQQAPMTATPTHTPTPTMVQTAPATPDRDYAFVANFGSFPYAPSSVSVIDTATRSVVGTIATGTGTNSIAVAPDGKRAYALNSTSYDISVIDIPSLRVIRTIKQVWPGGLALSPDGSTLYVSDGNLRRVVALSTADFHVRSVVATAGRGLIAADPGGAFLYATGSRWEPYTGSSPQTDHGIVSVIDVRTDRVIADIPVGDLPEEIVFSPVDDRVYVLGTGSNFISVIDRRRQLGMRLLASGPKPRGLAITPDGRTLYAANYGSYLNPLAIVSAIDTNGERPQQTIAVGAGPRDVAMSLDGRFVYVAEEFTDTVSVIDTGTQAVVGHIAVGDGPVAVTVARAVTVGSACHGDCNLDGRVTIDELMRAIDISLREEDSFECAAADADADGAVTVADLVTDVRAALQGCPH